MGVAYWRVGLRATRCRWRRIVQSVRRVAASVATGSRSPAPTAPTPRLQPGHAAAALDGLVARFGLAGRAARRGRRRGRAQALPRLQPDPRDRCSAPGSTRTPRLRHPAGLRHRPAGRDPGRQQDRPRPDRRRRRGRRGHHLGRAARRQRGHAPALLEVNRASTLGDRFKARAEPRPEHPFKPESRATRSRAPACPWATTRRRPARAGTSTGAQDDWRPRSHQRLAAAYDTGFFDDLVPP